MRRDTVDGQWSRFRDRVRSRLWVHLLALAGGACIVGNLLWVGVHNTSGWVRLGILVFDGMTAVPGLIFLALGVRHALREDAPPRWWQYRDGLIGLLGRPRS